MTPQGTLDYPPIESRACALCGRTSRDPEADRCKGCGFIVCRSCNRRLVMRPAHGLHEHSIEEKDVVTE